MNTAPQREIGASVTEKLAGERPFAPRDLWVPAQREYRSAMKGPARERFSKTSSYRHFGETDVKMLFSMGAVSFERELTAYIFHMQLIESWVEYMLRILELKTGINTEIDTRLGAASLFERPTSAMRRENVMRGLVSPVFGHRQSAVRRCPGQSGLG
jgi:hypothetical protein